MTFTIRKTHHGPLIEDDVALWWTYTQYPDNRIHEAFFGFSRAKEHGRSGALCRAHVTRRASTSCTAMIRGNIAWWASAKLPVRPAHVDTKTAIDGTDSTNDPTGWYPFAFESPIGESPERLCILCQQRARQRRRACTITRATTTAGNTRGAGIIEPSRPRTTGPWPTRRRCSSTTTHQSIQAQLRHACRIGRRQ